MTRAKLKAAWREVIHGTYDSYTQPQAFCLAACQYWVSGRADGVSDARLLQRLELCERHIAIRQKNIHRSEYSIPGMDEVRVAGKTLGIGDLRSADELFDIVLERDGLYIYGADTLLIGTGHAMAFEKNGEKFSFFDPNTGLWSVTGLGAMREQAIREWFSHYWKLYSWRYHWGDRELYSYTRGTGELLDARKDPYHYNTIPNF